MKVTTEQQEKLFLELDKLTNGSNQPPQEDEFTIIEYARHTGMSEEWTRKELMKLCELGILEQRTYKRQYLYKFKEEYATD